MPNCIACGTDLPADHPGIVAQKLNELINWDNLESERTFPVGAQFDRNGTGPITVVEKKLKPELDEIEGGYFQDGEYSQGTIFKTHIVVRYNGDYYKKNGEGDSYGNITWAGPLSVVKPVTKTVVTFE